MKLELRVADNAGACYGVKRAIEMAHEAAGKAAGRSGGKGAGETAQADDAPQACDAPEAPAAHPAPVHTLGPLIHNPRVVEALARDGVEVAGTIEEAGSGILVLRSHGTAPALVERARAHGFHVVDATCPYVSKVQEQARRLAEEGYAVLIIGEPGHAEVESIRAWGGDAVCAVCDSANALPEKLPARLGVVVQTTQSEERVESVLGAVRARVDELRVEKTVCRATVQRQKAAAALARESDVMLVVGGHNSGNTTRLAETAARHCARVHHIEAPDEVEASWFSEGDMVGVTAGASTPQEQIDEVLERLRGL